MTQRQRGLRTQMRPVIRLERKFVFNLIKSVSATFNHLCQRTWPGDTAGYVENNNGENALMAYLTHFLAFSFGAGFGFLLAGSFHAGARADKGMDE